jgi:hypothetical protein
MSRPDPSHKARTQPLTPGPSDDADDARSDPEPTEQPGETGQTSLGQRSRTPTTEAVNRPASKSALFLGSGKTPTVSVALPDVRKSLPPKLGLKKSLFMERLSRVANPKTSSVGPPSLNLLEQERRERAKAAKRDAHRMSEGLAKNFMKTLSDNIALSTIEEQMQARDNPWKSFWHGSLMPNSHLSSLLDVCQRNIRFCLC